MDMNLSNEVLKANRNKVVREIVSALQTLELDELLKINETVYHLIKRVSVDSSAVKAGVKVGDLVSFNTDKGFGIVEGTVENVTEGCAILGNCTKGSGGPWIVSFTEILKVRSSK